MAKPSLKTSLPPGMNPPPTLSATAQSWWRRLRLEYQIDDSAGLLLLGAAMEALDRTNDSEARVRRDGAFVKDRFGQLRPHPGIAVARDARGQLLASLKALNVDLEPLRDGPGRPPNLT